MYQSTLSAPVSLRNIAPTLIHRRLTAENPWWKKPTTPPLAQGLRHRDYWDEFFGLITLHDIHRAVVLLGPRRIGKTVMVFQAIAALIEQGIPPKNILYFTLENPIYQNSDLVSILEHHTACTGADWKDERCYIFIDEIQYRKDWERELKMAVDAHSPSKFVVTGSAAAALRMKSQESGAGRFTDFMLPPLSFAEFLNLRDEESLVEIDPDIEDLATAATPYWAPDITALNTAFLQYLDFGGYPEIALSETLRSDAGRFLRDDIIGKVLLRDLPSLYGISDIQELNSLFTTLAYNTGNEIAYGQLSQNSGLEANTLKRYIDYLEAAFLVQRVHRIDINARRFKRATQIKIYLTNSAMYAALFSGISAEDPKSPDYGRTVGHLVETAIFAQFFNQPQLDLHYAKVLSRPTGRDQAELDIVNLDNLQRPTWATEIKWSDRFAQKPELLKNQLKFCADHNLRQLTVTTKTHKETMTLNGIQTRFLPAALYAYGIGKARVQKP